jgi:Zn-finger protein
MNFLQEWEKGHYKKIFRELKEAGILPNIKNLDLIIKETSFETRSKKYPKECPYYIIGTSCHPEVKDLNCFLCACPNYESYKEEGGCKIDSKKGKWHYHKNLPKGKVLDCSGCNIYHSKKEVEAYLRDNLDKLNKYSKQDK